VDLPGVDSLDISLDGELRSAGVTGLHLSADRNEGRHAHSVFKRNTSNGWHGCEVLSEHSRLGS